MPETLKWSRLPGIRTESLGGYLAGIGLLKILDKKWAGVRGCWRTGVFGICAQQISTDEITAYLLGEWQPTPYRRWWKGEKELGPARAKASLEDVALLDSHIVSRGGTRNVYNPVFGTGGNVGKRDFAKVCAVSAGMRSDPSARDWLESTLFGRTDVVLPELPSTGTWFVHANKTFNSGTDVAREGQLSPWSWLLAFEGALCLSGGINRLLGASTQPYGAFPFVTLPPAPLDAAELGTVRAEFWAPEWNNPASLREVTSLLRRGLARVGYRAARSPAEFATAALSAGAQAGIQRFTRFSLRKTTSSNTFEAVRESVVETSDEKRLTASLSRITDWLSSLPKDKVSGQTRKFVGFQGAVERVVVRLAQSPEDPRIWLELLEIVARTQLRLDRSVGIRENKPFLGGLQTGLPQDVFDLLWPEPGPVERIAAAIASMSSGDYGLVHNVYGVPVNSARFGKERTASAVWHTGEPREVLCAILERRLVDAETLREAQGSGPLAAVVTAPTADLQAFLTDTRMPGKVAELLPVMSLFQWRKPLKASASSNRKEPPFSTFRLQALFRPLFLSLPLRLDASGLKEIRPNPARAKAIIASIRAESWRTAFDLARQAFSAAATEIVESPSSIRANGPEIGAALLIPVNAHAARRDFVNYWTFQNDLTGE